MPKTLLVTLSIILIILSGAFWAWATMFSNEGSVAIGFDQNQWKNDELTNQAPFIRLQMVEDLRANYLPKGLPKNSIIQLLGMPDSKNYFADYNLVYWLGPEQGLIQVDSTWLGIQLDSNNSLSHHQLLTD